jgi:hypothetical protein
MIWGIKEFQQGVGTHAQREEKSTGKNFFVAGDDCPITSLAELSQNRRTVDVG